MLMAAVNQFGIDFIRDDKHIMRLYNFRDRLKVIPVHHGTCRIVRVGKDQCFCTVCNRAFKAFRCETEIILFERFDTDRRCARKDNSGRIGNITRFRNQYFISRDRNGAQRKINCLGSTDCNKNLLFRVI